MPRGASVTAEIVCLFRALETARPAPRRVLEDPYAVHFLGRRWRRGMDLAWALQADLITLGLQRFVAARHRFIDDALLDFLARGGEQVVVLGAGYDSRALRMTEALAGRPLIEVDFPATQARKRRRLERAVAAGRIAALSEDTVTWLPIDFERQTLAQGLECGAFKPGLRTFFVWEGVAMYLAPATVQLTLSTLARLAAPGSELALDLWSPARHAGPAPLAFARRQSAKVLALLGEPLRFILPFDRVPHYFEPFGFQTADLLDAPGLARRYGLVERSVFPDICVARLVLDQASARAG